MPRVLRRLQITSVDSVDRGAGERVRVVLTKRHREEATMAKMETCPACHGTGKVAVAKADAPDYETVAKASALVLKSIAADIAKNERIPLSLAMVRAAYSPEYSEAHRQEKLMKFGPGY
jgi:hypothetical protein